MWDAGDIMEKQSEYGKEFLTGLIKRNKLNYEELNELKELESICNKHERLQMKTYWQDVNERAEEGTNDFLYIEDANIVGYLGVYDFGCQEVELIGMVHPNYRGKGIFRLLVCAAAEECRKRRIPKVLFICDDKSLSGKACINKLGAKYIFSDHKMEFYTIKNIYQNRETGRITLRRAKREDENEHNYINHICFHISNEEAKKDYQNSVDKNEILMYMVEVCGKIIGKIDVAVEKSVATIYQFGVLPEFRKQGYGREIINSVLKMLTEENYEKIVLEAASYNPHAMSLYRSCGFEEMGITNYYETTIFP